jgi:hypothetical protein
MEEEQAELTNFMLGELDCRNVKSLLDITAVWQGKLILPEVLFRRRSDSFFFFFLNFISF